MSADEGRQTFTTSDGREIRRPRKKNNKLTDRYQALVDGRLDITELDEEELARGQLRNADGHIRGAPPKAIPWVLHNAYVKHVGDRVERTIIGNMEDIVQGLIDIATGGIHDDTGVAMDVRVKAQTYLIDRILGRPTERKELDVKIHAKWEQAMSGGSLIVDLDDEPNPDIVDAELVGEVPDPSMPALPQATLVEEPVGREGEAVEQAPQAEAPPRRPTGVTLR